MSGLLIAKRRKTENWCRAVVRSIWLAAVLLLLPYGAGESLCRAQSGGIVWSTPVNLSKTPSLSTHPAIVSDDYGFVHAFWSEEVGGIARQPGDTGGAGNSILYTRWDGASWTPPVDILFVPGERVAEFFAVDIDSENKLHAVWTGQESFYYSTAPSWRAESAHAWSEPAAVATDSARSRYESDIAADAAGNLHIVYAARGEGAGVYHVHSRDGGKAWEPEQRLSEPFGPLERDFSTVRITADGADRLHVVWETGQEEGFGQAVYYVGSADMGESWSAPVQLGYRDPGDTFVGWPYLMADGESELHLIYIDGTNKGRLHRTSIDGGETWSQPRSILPEMEGINGYVVPVVDGAGQMHLIVNMRTRAEQVVGIYYAEWSGETWSPVVPLDTESPAAPSAHYTAATVRLGNELHVVYNQISVGEIWHLRGVVSAVEPSPTEALPRDPTPTQPAPTPTVTPATPVQVAQPESSQINSAAPAPSSWDTLRTLLPRVGLLLLLVASIVLWGKRRPR